MKRKCSLPSEAQSPANTSPHGRLNKQPFQQGGMRKRAQLCESKTGRVNHLHCNKGFFLWMLLLRFFLFFFFFVGGGELFYSCVPQLPRLFRKTRGAYLDPAAYSAHSDDGTPEGCSRST